MKKFQKIAAVLTIFIISPKTYSQFYTVTKAENKVVTEEVYALQNVDTLVVEKEIIEVDSIQLDKLKAEINSLKKAYKTQNDALRTFAQLMSEDTVPVVLPHKREETVDVAGLPKLTLINLYDEILRNGIAHPKIVLMQAILETGWFQSSVCRNKHNLFGLTNPRTADYYEFKHWTESVRAYYTKVQYRYKGGDYLTWLKKIGYAEDPGYISKLKVLLAQFD